MVTWIIRAISGDQHDKDHKPTDPEAGYSWSLANLEAGWKTGSFSYYREIEPLLKYFNVSKPEDLVGKFFTSPHDAANLAIDLLAIQVRHGGEYIPPTAKDIRMLAAREMAKMKQPCFDGIDKFSVWQAFSQMWNGFDLNPDMLSIFSLYINVASGGQVVLEQTGHAHTHGEPNFVLVKGDKRQALTLSPTSTPVWFERKPK